MAGISLAKVCSKCGKEYPATTEFFYDRKPNASHRGGLRGACKVCCSVSDRARFTANEEHIRQRWHQYRQLHPDQRRGRQRKPRQRKPWQCPTLTHAERLEHRNAYNTQYDAARRAARHERRKKQRRDPARAEVLRAQDAAYYAANRERLKRERQDPARQVEFRARWKASASRRRVRKVAGGSDYKAADVLSLLQAQHNKCWWCNKKLPAKGYHVDHRIPLCRGGGNGPDNIVISCATCNLRKHTQMPWEFAPGRLL